MPGNLGAGLREERGRAGILGGRGGGRSSDGECGGVGWWVPDSAAPRRGGRDRGVPLRPALSRL